MRCFLAVLFLIPIAGSITFGGRTLVSWRLGGSFDIVSMVLAFVCIGFAWSLFTILRRPDLVLDAEGKLKRKSSR